MVSTIRAALAMLLLALVSGMATPVPAQAPGPPCGGEKAPCKVALGSYYIAVPETAVLPGRLRPVVLFFHGAGGMGTTVLEPGSYLRPFVDAGYAVIGAHGLTRPGNAFGAGWSFRPQGPQQRDELAFAKEVLADATGRFGLDAKKVLVTGFSIGGSLVWYLACREPGLAAAYAPLAGGFWRPHPTACAGPVDLLQTHGWRDRTVPLEGRPLRGGELYQGDIFEGLQLWRSVNGCKGLRPDDFSTDAVFWRRTWSACESGRELSLALHPGDHDGVPMEWATMARLWFEARLKARPDTN
jgi:polyhydroxybutyrate depolymerase